MNDWWKPVGAALCVGLLGVLVAGGARQFARAEQAQSTSLQLASATMPDRPSATEFARLRDGFNAANANDWATVRALRDGASDTLVRRILQWRLAASSDAPTSFSDIAAALRELEDWPGRDSMRRRAELAIFDSALSFADRVAWLRAEGGPQSGEGKVALAQALRRTGQVEEATRLAREAWRENSLNGRAEEIVLDEFASALSSEDHAARVDRALWRGERGAAQRLMPRLRPEDRLLAQARIVLQTRPRRGVQAAVDAVPASRADDAGFLYDRARYIRISGRPEDAAIYARRIDARLAPEFARDDIFTEKRRHIARAMRNHDRETAYALTANHGMTSGEHFADAEWMAGWLALRFLNKPQEAAAHFAHLDENVSTPVSRARALYWRAEAARALGQNGDADARLEEAARYDFTYYGQLAAARRGGVMRLSESSPPVSDSVRIAFENRELVRALRLISEFGTQRDFESIAYYLDDTLDNPQELELLSNLAREASYMRTSVRAAKSGIRRGVIAVNAAFPMLELPARVRESSRPEPALVLAIIRQESEFDPRAVSHANARGLMQIIPPTARTTARRLGLSYQLAALTNDPEYNMTLGAAYLGDLIDNWGGSYVLAIASYNAGPGRAREWINDWGDPRRRDVDVVDWIELIPISETRNYIQRVLENLQVYRHRLAGAPSPIAIEQDLRRGQF
ncbi:MAG: lytic transglycosylase domain-containing protein [Hydrogenophilaceae bacterium]|jgi:soluble lytic murein transglycosylase|nr:lytic transglycosylase domain-containing protein [Hydrogenophilaceae bacterium]